MGVTAFLCGAAKTVAERTGFRFPMEDFASSANEVPEAERNLTPMHAAFYGNTGSSVHKWRHYLSVYDQHLSRYRNQPIRLLEIGVSKGGSLLMWRRYFGEAAIIFGVDIDETCASHNGRGGQVRIGSQADPKFLKQVVSEMGGLDVVIDDGSHVAAHQLISFQTLFPLVDRSGVYICEDTHTAYLTGFGGGYRKSSSFIEVAKQAVDDMHADFHGRPSTLEHAHRTINSVTFYNSMVVIEKHPQRRPSHLSVPA